MDVIDGYITDLSLEEAINILDSLLLNPLIARGCGKTRMLHNNAIAWVKVRANLPTIDNTLESEKRKHKSEVIKRHAELIEKRKQRLNLKGEKE